MNKVIIFGYSGHAYVLIESMIKKNFQPIGYFSKIANALNPYRLKYLGFEESVEIKSLVQNCFLFPAIGDNSIRMKIINFIEQEGLKTFSLVDISAHVSNSVLINNQSYVGSNAIINAHSKIGKGVIINTAAVIEHECIIGDYTHIAPNATICGNVTIGNNSFVGAGAIVKQGVNIGNNVTIGAGTVVLKNIVNNEVWVGNPASKIKKNE